MNRANTSSPDKNWFYLAMGLISFMTVNFATDKYKQWSKNNKKKENKAQKQKNSQKNVEILPSKAKSVPPIHQEKTNIEKPRSYATNFKPKNVFKIALTGGPCAGKTTGIQ